jgi:hypothetical protein
MYDGIGSGLVFQDRIVGSPVDPADGVTRNDQEIVNHGLEALATSISCEGAIRSEEK